MSDSSNGRTGRRRRRIPFVQQLTDTECGAASLAMVLGYHGKEVGLDAVRDLCGAGRDGLSAAALLDGAERMGLRGRGMGVDVDQLAMLEPGATILHWRFDHFVVLARVEADWVEIVDPAVGRRRVPMSEVRKEFTGVALVFEPNELFRAHRTRGALAGTVKRLILGSGLLPRVLVMSLLLQLCGLAFPMMTGLLVDRVLPRADVQLLTMLLVGLGLVAVFGGIAELVRGHLLVHLRTVLNTRMTRGFLDHLVSLPYSYFQRRSAGDLLTRLNSNAIVREHLTSGALSAILDGLLVVVYLVVLFVGNWAMAVAALVAGTLDVAVYLITRRQQRELMGQGLQAETRSHSYEVEMLTSMETLKAGGNEQRAVAHWSNLFVNALNVSLRRDRLSMKTEAVLGVVRAAGPLTIIATGAVQVLAGGVTLGTMLALSAVAGSFLSPLAGLVHTAMSLEVVRGYLARVNEVLEAAPEQDGVKTRPAPRLTGHLTLDGVSFRYSPQAPLVVRGVSVEILPGQFVAIVGRSGSGKSTLANLILGLYPPETGRVLFDGADIAGLDLRSLRQQLGIVNQNLGLFGTTVRQNIALSDPSLSLAQVVAAARVACIHHEIADMPLGYNTPLVDRGGSLSGGQRQRLALARALVRSPALLLLDEATSALDAVTESQVQASLAQLRCTRIVIAHRLSTIRDADLILVMDRGAVVERGTHDQLLARGGHYARLVAGQMGPSPGAVLDPDQPVTSTLILEGPAPEALAPPVHTDRNNGHSPRPSARRTRSPSSRKPAPGPGMGNP